MACDFRVQEIIVQVFFKRKEKSKLNWLNVISLDCFENAVNAQLNLLFPRKNAFFFWTGFVTIKAS